MPKPITIAFVRKRLPHWEVEGGRYFVTIGRAGAIPAEAAQKIHRLSRELGQLRGGPLLDQRRRIFLEMEAWLDHAPTMNDLVQPNIAAMLQEAIKCRHEGRVWNVYRYTIMPSHLHLFFSIGLNGTGLIRTVENFKRWTARQAVQWGAQHGTPFWAREWFDHWSRSPEEDEKIIRYIRNNPVKAGLVDDDRQWPWQ